MTFVLGVHAPLNYSVVFADASYFLASRAPDMLSIDKLCKLKSTHRKRKESSLAD
jgi:hypothetical protein